MKRPPSDEIRKWGLITTKRELVRWFWFFFGILVATGSLALFVFTKTATDTRSFYHNGVHNTHIATYRLVTGEILSLQTIERKNPRYTGDQVPTWLQDAANEAEPRWLE